MMASPSDLEDFGVGFSLSEGIVADADEIASLDVIPQDKGIELRLWLTPDRGRNLAERRRRIAGPTGCGLCGVESLEAAVPTCPHVSAGLIVHPDEIACALAALLPAQALHQRTHAVHGAAFWCAARGLVALAEDVGRHNALDKLIGGLLKRGVDPLSGFVVVTSRASFEMVQKATVLGAPLLAAISGPTGLAVRVAQQSGLTLVGFVRGGRLTVYTHPGRVSR
jgi:FdhD protein